MSYGTMTSLLRAPYHNGQSSFSFIDVLHSRETQRLNLFGWQGLEIELDCAGFAEFKGGRRHDAFLFQIKGITWLDDILCSAVSQDSVKLAGQEATAVLRDRHHLRPEEEDDFNIRNPEDIIQAQLDASKTLTILLIAIASV